MNLIKVDIQTGEVLQNNLREFWAREPVRRNLKIPARQPGPDHHIPCPGERLQPEKVDPALMDRVKKFRSRVKRKSNSWGDEELYRLAVLIGRMKMPYRQAGCYLARSPDACKYMYRVMRRAGVI